MLLFTCIQEATPTVGLIVNRKSSSCRKLKYSARRYNTRQSRDYYEGPMTRSMRTKFGGEGGEEKAKSAEPSFLDDEYHFRVAPRKVLCFILMRCGYLLVLLVASVRSRTRGD